MNPIAAIVRAKLRMAVHWTKSVRTESKLKVAFVSVSFVLLWLFTFGATLGGLELLKRFATDFFGVADSGLMDVLLSRMLSVGALAVSIMLLVSNVLISFATIYRAKEVIYLVQAPISRAEFFLGRLWECAWMSSWALAAVGSPVLLAYGIHRGVGWAFYLALLLFYPVFVAIPTAAGAMISTILVRVLATQRRGAILGLAGIALVLLFLFFRSSGSLPDFSQAESVQAVADTLGRAERPLLPSYWLSEGLLSAAVGDLGRTALLWLVTAANAIFFIWLATLLSERLFYRGWTSLLASDEQRGPSKTGGILRLIDAPLAALKDPARSLVSKDIKLFWRDPSQWSQFLIFFGLMALYVANMKRSGGVLAEDQFRPWVAILNMAASMLVLATLTTRFVFPLISLEGRRIWILGLAPLTWRRLVAQKYLLSVATCSFFTVGLALLTGWRLELSGFEFFVTLFGAVSATLALSGLAVGLGSLYPNFREDNPSRIISGLGGTLNFILSLVFIVLVVTLQAFAVQWNSVPELGGGSARSVGSALALVAVALLTLMAAAVPLYLGLRNLRRTDF